MALDTEEEQVEKIQRFGILINIYYHWIVVC